MSWKRYQNELMVLAAFLLMVVMFSYKHNAASSQSSEMNTVQNTIEEIKEVTALKKVWADKKTVKKIENLKKLIPASKMKWSKKGTKITVFYTGLKPSELNKLITKILNLPIEIDKLLIQKIGSSYNVEFKCKW